MAGKLLCTRICATLGVVIVVTLQVQTAGVCSRSYGSWRCLKRTGRNQRHEVDRKQTLWSSEASPPLTRSVTQWRHDNVSAPLKQWRFARNFVYLWGEGWVKTRICRGAGTH